MIFQLENKNIHASDSGQGIDTNKDTIVFLHGSGLSHIVWSLAEQFFSSKNYNVLSIDLPGHGNSDGPCLESIEKIADWLEQVFVNILESDQLKLSFLILIYQKLFLTNQQFFQYFLNKDRLNCHVQVNL